MINVRPQFSNHLLSLVVTAKDAVHREHRESAARFFDLHDRIGRLVALYLEDPIKAKAEIVQLCDLEFDLTGDTVATGDLAEALDPDGEFFEKTHGPKFVLETEDGEFELDAVLAKSWEEPNEDAAQVLAALVVGDATTLTNKERGSVTVTRVS